MRLPPEVISFWTTSFLPFMGYYFVVLLVFSALMLFPFKSQKKTVLEADSTNTKTGEN